MVVNSLFHRNLIDIHDFWENLHNYCSHTFASNTMVLSFTIRYCDIDLENHLKILVNKLGKFALGMLGVVYMIPQLILPGSS